MSDAVQVVRKALSASKMMRQISVNLQSYALEKCLEAVPHLEMIPDAFGEYTDHGVAHSCSVLDLADSLLAMNRLNEWEVLIFVLSAFYHDIGMSCPPEVLISVQEDDKFKREIRYLKAVALQDASVADGGPLKIHAQVVREYLRKHHGDLGRSRIIELFPLESRESMVENTYVWELVSRVCAGHTLSFRDLRSEQYTRSATIRTLKCVDVRFLTCLLRLADVCHLSRDRALPYIRKAMTFNSQLSRDIWGAVGDVEGVSCDEARGAILVSAKPRSFERHRMIASMISEIAAELQNAHRLLSDRSGYQFPWRLVDDAEVRPHPTATYIFEPDASFRLVHEKIIQLLMGSRLYADPLYALRECLQNAVDSVRLVRLKMQYAVGRVVVGYSSLPGRAAFLDIFDNGTGMDREICLRHLLSVGSNSFAMSERRYVDWGMTGDGIQLIAQHGIGFLSCFMLADTVEVFSRYPGAEPVHLVLDSPTLVGEFRATCEAEFPVWDAVVLPEASPWDEGHGTCVRLHLREPVSKFDLMRFLSRNVLRVGERIIVMYDREAVELSDVWGQAEDWYNSREDSSLTEIKERLFTKKERAGFYSGPPRDSSQEEVLDMDGDIRGMVRLKSGGGDYSRLSQEGFLVRDGAVSLLSTDPRARVTGSFPFYFDIDVRRSRCFALDAERARVASGQSELVAELVKWIEERGLRSIGAIESPLFFPCGGTYYHGGSDLLEADDNREVAFHGDLRGWYTPERMAEILARGDFNPFLRAKLYTVVGDAHCTPVSIENMRGGEFFVLILKASHPDGESDDELSDGMYEEPDYEVDDEAEDEADAELSFSFMKRGRRLDANSRQVLDDVSRVADLGKVIFLPNLSESFTLPLSVVFRFEWIDISQHAMLGRLIEKEEWGVADGDMILRKLKEAGKP